MATIKITELPVITGADAASNDVLPIVDISVDVTKKITRNELFTSIPTASVAGDFFIADRIVHSGDTDTVIRFPAADTVTVETAGAERLRVSSTGNVGVGTNSPQATLHVNGGMRQGNTGSFTSFDQQTLSSSASVSASTALVSRNENFIAVCSIEQNIATSGGGSVLFRTTPAGDRATDRRVERARIDGNGAFLIGKTVVDSGATAGTEFRSSGQLFSTVSGNSVINVNRLASDGNLVVFAQDGTTEGQISVSGTTVSYVGGHLARFSQLLDKSRPELLKGTVLSNLDEMAGWGDEENEQLNCVKVSDVASDKNVAGVFVAWDGETSDLILGMTGDLIIRVGKGVTVKRGDLLVSAGDGTAKPQADDVVRSSTVAKVISNKVTCIYDDGSYCVPCVLMAC